MSVFCEVVDKTKSIIIDQTFIICSHLTSAFHPVGLQSLTGLTNTDR